MIGKIYRSLLPFYNRSAQRMSYKGRPVLIIGEADSGDYNVLPLSRVTRQEHLSREYDVRVDPALYPRLNLTAISYIRAHKQTVIHRGSVDILYGDLKGCYPDLYRTILLALENYNRRLLENARAF